MQARERVSALWHTNKNTLTLLVICITTVALTYILQFQHIGTFSFDEPDMIYKIESRLFDWKLKNRDSVPTSGKVGILAIDNKTVRTFESYPIKRQYFRTAFQNLKSLGVSWIGFDIFYDKPQETKLGDVSELFSDLTQGSTAAKKSALKKLEAMKKMSLNDNELIKGISDFENIVLGYYIYMYEAEMKGLGDKIEAFEGIEALEDSELFSDFACESNDDAECLRNYKQLVHAKGIQLSTAEIQSASNHAGFFSNQADQDAINRWITLVAEVNGMMMPSLALKTAAEYLDRDVAIFFDADGIENISLIDREDQTDEIRIPVDPRGKGRMLINHRGKGEGPFPHFSLADAYNNSFTEAEKKKLKGSVLLLGATATGSNDFRPNPYDSAIDGVENHAAAIDNILLQDWYKRPVSIYEIELMIVLGIGLLFAPIMIFGRAILSGVSVIIFIVAYYYVDKYVWFEKGTWSYMAVPYLEIVTMYLSTTLYKYITEENERNKVKGAFQHYLSPEVIDEILDDPEKLTTGGVKKSCTVYFSDVRGFTTTSETLKPEELSLYMNHYFTPMANRILQTGGCLDKFIGDAIMAFWGAPLDMHDHAEVAAQTAVDHLYDLDKVRSDMKQMGFPPPLIGIGLNTGEMTVGNMGCDARFSYTAMGDSVNLGARLEGLTKEYGITIMISESTQKFLKPNDFFYRELDDITVKGKKESVRVYDLMRPDLLSQEQHLRDLIGNFGLAREAYRSRKWTEAEKLFLECLALKADDGPSLKYLERIAFFKETPPSHNWDGVYRFNHK
ncbi:adenylate/guanylate cyclase domain-containing protein [Oligoflexaceae bacterium]|nr:adenylate/guanylate cyclase domain-containing protein [Oligoflexaceae bacterium]